MRLYLIRHASAEEAGEGRSEEGRALTRDGITKFRRAAQGMVRIVAEAGLPLILTSPLVRARQTAGLLAEALDNARIKSQIRESAALSPPGDLRKFLRELRSARDAVAAVGHEPYLSEWLGQLCFQSNGAAEMKKGAVAAIELDAAGTRGELLFLMPPSILRKI